MEKRKIASFYEHDHDQLDNYFQEYKKLKNTDYPQAKECFQNFESGLHRHIQWEEDILFPLFEEKTGMADHGPTAVMREEHKQIKEYLQEINKKVATEDVNTDNEEQLLEDLLGSHNQKEENILYPGIDEVISDSERENVFERMNLKE